MDEQGLRIAENQENSQKNRRKLAESTRGMFCLLWHSSCGEKIDLKEVALYKQFYLSILGN